MQLAVGVLARGDVLNQGDEVVDRAVAAANHACSDVGVDDHAVLPDVALLEFIGVDFAGDGAIDAGEAARTVIRVGQFHPAFTQQFRARIAENIADGLIDFDPLALR